MYWLGKLILLLVAINVGVVSGAPIWSWKQPKDAASSPSPSSENIPLVPWEQTETVVRKEKAERNRLIMSGEIQPETASERVLEAYTWSYRMLDKDQQQQVKNLGPEIDSLAKQLNKARGTNTRAAVREADRLGKEWKKLSKKLPSDFRDAFVNMAFVPIGAA